MSALMGGELARMVFTDPPYNVRIQGNVRGLGTVKHREFAMAGEMSQLEFTGFLKEAFEPDPIFVGRLDSFYLRGLASSDAGDPDPPNWSMLRATFSGILNPMEGGCHEAEAVFGGADCLCVEAG